MATYEVIRSFPSHTRGETVENPPWKNLVRLVRTGYLREVVKPEVVAVEESKPLPVKKTSIRK